MGKTGEKGVYGLSFVQCLFVGKQRVLGYQWGTILLLVHAGRQDAAMGFNGGERERACGFAYIQQHQSQLVGTQNEPYHHRGTESFRLWDNVVGD